MKGVLMMIAVSTLYLISNMLRLAVIPAGIAGIHKPRMAIYRTHPCVLDSGNPCRNDDFGAG